MTDTFVIVPGEVNDLALLPTDREYWYLKCPACGEAHERTITQYWVDADTPDEVSRDVTKHCFICAEYGIHYQINPLPPFGILREIRYRPPKIEKVEEGEGHEDYREPF